MKKALKKSTIQKLFFYHNGIKKIINPQDKSSCSPDLTVNISGLYGKISPDLYGNISPGLTGNISDLTGNISGLYGNCTNIEGDIDNCKLTDKEREKGVNIEDLIMSPSEKRRRIRNIRKKYGPN